MKKAEVALALLLAVTLVTAGNSSVRFGWANPSSIIWVPSENAYIKSNGDIEPANLPIERIGNLYVLKETMVNYTIEIQKDNIVFDGNGFTLTSHTWTGSSGPPLVQISNRTNLIVKNVEFEGGYAGIQVNNSSNISILNNTFAREDQGVYLSSCKNCNIIDNQLVDNSGPGLFIMDSSCLNITYNIISRNHFHGGWIAVSYSNISRNNITDNSFNGFGIGLYLYGANSYNNIYENNFINNEVGLFYQGSRGVSFSNKVYSNYWDNYGENIVNVAADEFSGRDQSPLTSPVSVEIAPVYPTLLPSDDSTSILQLFPATLVIASLSAVSIVSMGLLVYFKKHKERKQS